MIECMIAAPASGSGKTMVTCALLTALKRRGLNPCAFKCGPDYIDPMFHREALGLESRNLDLFLAAPEIVQGLYARGCAGHGAAVCEGVMGYYDGIGGRTDRASAWSVAHLLHIPTLLVLRPKGASLTLAAQVKGMCSFRTPNHLAGILLNDCSESYYQNLKPMLEQETGLPVLGYLPPLPQAEVKSRHLGLYTASELEDLTHRMDKLARQMEETVEIDRLLSLTRRDRPQRDKLPLPPPRVRIGVAHDEAFSFWYDETGETLRLAGAELVTFRPTEDAALPPHLGALYLPGGYPERFAAALAANETMRGDIRKAARDGMPMVAECGGFLYLGETLQGEDGAWYPMAGCLPGCGKRTERLVRFGYAELTAHEDSLLFRKGETLPAHEFHYWDSTQNGDALTARKPLTDRSWTCGYATPTLYAGFPHLYFAGAPQLAARFVEAAREYAGKQLWN